MRRLPLFLLLIGMSAAAGVTAAAALDLYERAAAWTRDDRAPRVRVLTVTMPWSPPR